MILVSWKRTWKPEPRQVTVKGAKRTAAKSGSGEIEKLVEIIGHISLV